MGYLANIIHDARRQSAMGNSVPLPVAETPRTDSGFVDGEVVATGSPASLLSSVMSQNAVMRTPLEPSNHHELFGSAKTLSSGSESAVQHPYHQAPQADPKQVTPPPHANGSFQQAKIADKGPSGSVVPIRTELETDVSPVENATREIPRPGVFEVPPALSSHVSQKVLASKAIPVSGKITRLSSSVKIDDLEQNDDVQEVSAPAERLSHPVADRAISSAEDSGREAVPATMLPPLTSDTQESVMQNDGSLYSSKDTPAQEVHVTMSEERMWRQDSTVSNKTHPMAAEPRVHIGRIEVVILSPEPTRQSTQPASSAGGVVNRQYLRRL